MQAIQVKRIGCTNTRPERLRAWCASGALVVSVHSIPPNVNQLRHAAELLRARLGWLPASGGTFELPLLQGSLPDGSACFVFDNHLARE